MSSINDWAAKAADRIYDDTKFGLKDNFASGNFNPDRFTMPLSKARIAAIITTFADPLVALLRESKKEHQFWCSAVMYFSGRLTGRPCNCEADTWNARVDAILEGMNSV